MATNFSPGWGLGRDSHRILGFGLGGWLDPEDARPFGKWKIDSLTVNDTKAMLQLRERKVAADVVVPKSEFERTTYPNLPEDNIGLSIPIGFGVVKGAQAILINSQTNRFKWLAHSVSTVDGFFDADGVPYTPDSINLTTSEFTYTAWDGETDLFVNYTADLDNPVDVAKALLTDEVRGANLPQTALDTTSTGKGFGPNGARVGYIKGTITRTGVEVPIYQIGLHISEPTQIKKILDQIQAATFGFIFVDFDNVWQYKRWLPVPGEGLPAITEKMIVGELKPSMSTVNSATKCIAKFSENLATGDFQREIHSDDELRQLRDLTAHTIIEKPLPLSNRDGARDWAQKIVATRGRPRRIFKFSATSELKLAEPGDHYRLSYEPQGIDEVVILTSVRRTAGETMVGIEAIDNFGLRDTPGVYTDDAPLNFPDSLGGGSFSDWSDAVTDAQKIWVKENWGIYQDSNGYADELDPFFSHWLSLYF
jgi:hypothetical protein